MLKATDLIFRQHELEAAEACWPPVYIQHSAHIPPGRAGLFELTRSPPANLIAADIMRLKDAVLVEHREVLQNKATKA